MTDDKNATPFGLRVLSEPVEPDKLSVNIVAVHGFNGHWDHSWALRVEGDGGDRGASTSDMEATIKTWLQESLAKQFENAQIMTFGYESVIGDSLGILQITRFQEVARQLLQALWTRTSSNPNIPIVFICQDVGGLLVKEMLRVANRDRNYIRVALETQLLVFYQVLQKETKDAPWMELLLGLALETQRALATTRSGKRWALERSILVQAILGSGPHTARAVSEEFLHWGRQYKILSFHLTGLFGDMVISEAVTTSGLSNEITKGISTNQLGLWFYPPGGDSTFDILCDAIRNVKQGTGNYLDYRLEFCPMECPRLALPHVQSASVPEWIVENELLKQWFEDSSLTLLHITGLPSSGKSTICTYVKTYLQLPDPKQQPTLILDYSFDKGIGLRDCVRKMLLSLVEQILLLGQKGFESAIKQVSDQVKKRPEPLWSNEDLWVVIRSFVRFWEGQILCIVDSIDRCKDAEPLDLIRTMQGLDKGDIKGVFKLLVTSEKQCTQDDGQDGLTQRVRTLSMVLDDQPAAFADRWHAIWKRLYSLSSSRLFATWGRDKLKSQADLSIADIENITTALKYCASHSTETLSAERQSVLEFTLELLIQKAITPLTTTEHLYCRLTGQLHAITSLPILEKLLPWLDVCQTRLTLNLLAVAMAVESGCQSLESIKNCIAENILNIHSVVGVIIEIEGDEIRPIHRPILSMFMQSGDASWIKKHHACLGLICLRFLQMDGVNSLWSGEMEPGKNQSSTGACTNSLACLTFLKYAARFWLAHVREAQQDADPECERLNANLRALIVDFGRFKWAIEMYCVLNKNSRLHAFIPTQDSAIEKFLTIEVCNEYSHQKDMYLLIISSYFGLHGLARELRAECNDMDREIQDLILIAASFTGEHEVLQLLDTDTVLESTITQVFQHLCTYGHNFMLKLLLEQFHERLTKLDLSLDPFLTTAAMYGHTEIVITLLDAGARCTLKDNHPQPFHYAAANGHVYILQIVLDRDPAANPSNSDDNGFTPLHHAAVNGHLDAVKTLLSHPRFKSEDVNTPEWIMKPLHLAAQGGFDEIVSILLDKGANTAASGVQRYTALHYAVENGHIQTVKVLVRAGADVDATDEVGETPLHKASTVEMVEYLLQAGSNPDTPTEKSRIRPLHKCSHKANGASLARCLLEYGANVDSMYTINPENGKPSTRSALIDACDKTEPDVSIEFIKLLIEFGADVNKADANETHPLGFAARKGHADIVELLLHHGADIHHIDNDGSQRMTPLRRAILCSGARGLLVVKILLSHGASANETYPDGETALFAASDIGYVDVVRVLLEHGSNMNQTIKLTGDYAFEGTVLQYAAWAGNLEMVKLLVNWKPGEILNNINFVPPDTLTALMRASACGEHEVVKYLLENGAQTGIRGEWKTVNVRATALGFAVYWGKEECVQLLLDARANPNVLVTDTCDRCALQVAAQFNYSRIVDLLLSHGANPNSVSKVSATDETTPLISATWTDNIECVDLLLKAGADINYVPPDGYTALQRAVANGKAEMVEFLLEHGAEPNIASKTGNIKSTALILAATNGHIECADLLLKAGIDVNYAPPVGYTALQRAAANGGAEMVEFLLKHGAEPNIASKTKNINSTALILAAMNGHIECVDLLLKAGIDINYVPPDGYTALGRATANGKTEMIKHLLKLGAAVNLEMSISIGNITPLTYALWNGECDSVDVLLNHGAVVDVNAITEGGHSLLFYAAASGSVVLTQLMLDKGLSPLHRDVFERTVLDVALHKPVRELLEQHTPRLSMTRTTSLIEGTHPYSTCGYLNGNSENLYTSQNAYCDVCNEYRQNNNPRGTFYYHCCKCLDGQDNSLVCVVCYQSGKRAPGCTPGENGHSYRAEFHGHGMMSVEELSPWVTKLKDPKEILELDEDGNDLRQYIEPQMA